MKADKVQQLVRKEDVQEETKKFFHSRAIVSDVSSAAMIMVITPIRPGTMKLRDTRSVLYQTRT